MFSDHSPCCPYLWNLSSRVPICLHPRLHGGASTSHFWSAGLGLLLLSALPQLSHYWRSLSVRNCCQDWPSAPYQQGFTTRHIPCASPIACKECLQELASRLTPWTHIHHMSQRACINCPTCPSNPRHEIPVPEAQKLSSACTESAESSCEGAGQRASSRWPRRGGFARQSLPWRQTFLTVSEVVCSSHPASHPGSCKCSRGTDH